MRRQARLAVRLVAVLAAIVLVVAGASLVFVLNGASPSPSHVLDKAASFAVGATSLTYSGTESITVPAPDGASLVRHRTFSGSTALSAASATDVIVNEGAGGREWVFAPGGGVWVRATSENRLGGWVHAAAIAAYEGALIGRQIPTHLLPYPSQSGVVAAFSDLFADAAVDGRIIPALLAGARNPSRVGSSVRSLNLTLTPNGAFGTVGLQVTVLTGTVVVDSHDRPQSFSLLMTTPAGSVSVAMKLSWNAPVNVVVPGAGAAAYTIVAPPAS